MIKCVNFAEYQDEIVGMMMDMVHLEPQPVDIPIDYYIELQELGILHPFIWFDQDAIKGIMILCIAPSIRNLSIKVAQTDVLWVKPEYRGDSSIFLLGVKEYLQQIGVHYFMVSSRDSTPIDNFLTKNGFKPLEQVFYQKLIRS